MLEKIRSLADLQYRARTDTRYARLAMVAAENLGQPGDTLPEAIQSLENCVMECGEPLTVAEINHVRDLVE